MDRLAIIQGQKTVETTPRLLSKKANESMDRLAIIHIPSFSSCISSYISFSLFFGLYERGVTRRIKNTVSSPPTVPPLCLLRRSLLKGINTKMSESQASMIKLTENWFFHFVTTN